MLNIFFLLISIIVIILAIVSVWAIIFFIINYKKNHALYRSVFRTLFKNLLSISIIIIFYGISFALIGGAINYVTTVEKATNVQTIDNHVHQVDDTGGSINEERAGIYENGYNEKMFYYLIQDYDNRKPYVIDSNNDLGNEDNFIREIDAFVSDEYGYSGNFWEDLGSNYFGSFNDFVTVLTYKTFFDNFNSDSSQFGIEDPGYEIVYNIYPNDVYKPYSGSNSNNLYYFMGYNSPPPKDSTSSQNPLEYLRYSGENNQYFVDDFVIQDIENGYTREKIDQELSISNSDYGNGTRNDPYKIVLQKEYAEKNNIKAGDIISIDQYNFEVLATANFSNVMYPSYNISSVISDQENQSAILMNTNALLEINDENLKYTVNYGYTDLYDQIDDYSYYFGYSDEGNNSELFYRTEELREIMISETGDSFYSSNHGLITNENYSQESWRVSAVYYEINRDIAFVNIFSKVFLIIVIIVLILLINKRIKDFSKQFGTLKALGMTNRESSVAFLVYPMFIIAIGGLIAFLLAFPIGMIFLWAIAKFCSLPLAGYQVSFSIFYTLFIFSAIILFGIVYLISNWILRKPSIDLLSNKVDNSPNILTRASGKLIPNEASFSFSYKFKGFTRASGKSMILIFAIFFSTFLTSLSLASITMINTIENETNDALKFEYYNGIKFYDNNYDIYDLNDFDDKENYGGKKPLYSDQLIIYDYDQQKIDFDPISSYIQKDSYDPEKAYQALGKKVTSSFDKEVVVYNEATSDYEIDYYLPKEAILNYLISWNLIKWSVDDPDAREELANTLWEGTNYSASSLNKFIEVFAANAYSKYFYANKEFYQKINYQEIGRNLSRNQIEEIAKEIYFYSSDVNFRDIYYDSSVQTISSNDDSLVLYPENSDTKNTLALNIFNNPESINELYKMDQEAIDALEAEEELMEQEGELDYIPVILDSYTYDYFMKYYDIPVDPETGYWELGFDDGDSRDLKLDVEVKVVYVYDSYLSFGYFTTEDLIQNYPPLSDQNYQVSYNAVTWNDNSSPKSNYTLAVNDNHQNENLSFSYFVDNPRNLEGITFSKNLVTDQMTVLYTIIRIYLLVVSAFALMIGMVLIFIAMKEINNNSKREVSLLKSFGYSDLEATFLVLTPFLIVLLLGFLLSIPFSIAFLTFLEFILTEFTGMTFIFSLTILQWFVICFFLIFIISLLFIYSYFSFKRSNPLDAIKETDT